MNFEWDTTKARANKSKHSVEFLEASEVFADACSSTTPDPDHSVGEERYLIFGKSKQERHLVVGFTDRGDTIRIITARAMTRRERIAYER